MYGRNPWGSTYLKPEGKALKEYIFWNTKEKMPKDTEIGYELIVRGSWYNKSKNAKTRIKKRDANNLIKLIVDACCDALEIDDSQIFKESVQKHDSPNEGFSIRFYLL